MDGNERARKESEKGRIVSTQSPDKNKHGQGGVDVREREVVRAFLAAEMCVADETQINTQRETRILPSRALASAASSSR